jgi:hypothetical protein
MRNKLSFILGPVGARSRYDALAGRGGGRGAGRGAGRPPIVPPRSSSAPQPIGASSPNPIQPKISGSSVTKPGSKRIAAVIDNRGGQQEKNKTVKKSKTITSNE